MRQPWSYRLDQSCKVRWIVHYFSPRNNLSRTFLRIRSACSLPLDACDDTSTQIWSTSHDAKPCGWTNPRNTDCGAGAWRMIRSARWWIRERSGRWRSCSRGHAGLVWERRCPGRFRWAVRSLPALRWGPRWMRAWHLLRPCWRWCYDCRSRLHRRLQAARKRPVGGFQQTRLRPYSE